MTSMGGEGIESLAGGASMTAAGGSFSLPEIFEGRGEDVKSCPRCGEEKPMSEFSPDASKSDGRASRCRPCDRERARAYYARHRAERSEYFRRRYQERKAKHV